MFGYHIASIVTLVIGFILLIEGLSPELSSNASVLAGTFLILGGTAMLVFAMVYGRETRRPFT